MKIQIASDLHLEALPAEKQILLERDAPHGLVRARECLRADLLPARFQPVPDRDLLVLAGDIGTDMLALDFIERELKLSPVIYVPGNHEYYSVRSRDEIGLEWRRLAGEHRDLHYLVCEGLALDGVRFWGALVFRSVGRDAVR